MTYLSKKKSLNNIKKSFILFRCQNKTQPCESYTFFRGDIKMPTKTNSQFYSILFRWIIFEWAGWNYYNIVVRPQTEDIIRQGIITRYYYYYFIIFTYDTNAETTGTLGVSIKNNILFSRHSFEIPTFRF